MDKKLFLIALLLAALLLSGCIGQESSGVSPSAGPPPLPPEAEQLDRYMRLVERAWEENSPAYCQEIDDSGFKEMCLSHFEE